MGYNVFDTGLNARNHGLPRSQARYWIIGTERIPRTKEFKWPDTVTPVPLSDLLVPKRADPSDPNFRPTNSTATKHIDQATTVAKRKRPDQEWVITEHCSAKYMPFPKSQWLSPALP